MHGAVGGGAWPSPRGAAAGLVLLLAGCDLSFRHDDGDTRVEGRVRGEGAAALVLASPGGEAPSSIRADGELRIRFSDGLDPLTVRGAVRVVDLSRERDPVAVLCRVEGERLVVRARSDRGFRPGARLEVTIAGRPSVRALRSRRGASLDEDSRLEVDILSRRRADRVAPVLLSSSPADGDVDVDPDGTLSLVFSEPLDPLSVGPGEVPLGRGGVRVLADGRPLPMAAHLDRHRSTLTLLAGAGDAGLPGAAEVVVEIGPRLRDRDGNRLDAESPRTVRFRTAPRHMTSPVRGHFVESFDDDLAADPLATTAAWADPAHPGVLRGAPAPRSLEVTAAGVPRPLPLDPGGGVVRLPVLAVDLGPEPRYLTSLHVRGMAGPGAGELLGVRVRLAPLALLASPWGDAGDGSGWRVVVAGEGLVAPVGPEHLYSFPFLQEFRHDGLTDLVVEISWSGVTGPVLLAGHGRERPGGGAGGAAPPLPDLRFDGIGERAVAQSRWFDAGGDGVTWLAPRAGPSAGAGGVRVEVQAAPASEAHGGPDADRASPWVSGGEQTTAGRWVRFRVLFDDPGAAPPALVDDVVLPFLRR